MRNVFRYAVVLSIVSILLTSMTARAQTTGSPPLIDRVAIANQNLQEDFPAVCVDSDGMPWVVYLENDGKADTLKIARSMEKNLQPVGSLSKPGVIHQPAVACDGRGTVWAIWSELDAKNAWSLNARQIVDGKIQPETVALESDSGSAIFADAGTDRQGRVWVTWQSFRGALGDIFAISFDPATGKWSDEIQVTTNPAGDWEPRLAFTDDTTWIAFDSSRNDNFNVYLAKVDTKGKVDLTQLSKTSRYEARPSIAATPDGRGLWVAWENGRQRWGKDSRGVDANAGLNADKRIDVIYYDIASQKIKPTTDITPVLKSVGRPKPMKRPSVVKPKNPKKKKGPQGIASVNLPKVLIDAKGTPWLACRYYQATHWKIALLKYEPSQAKWSEPRTINGSEFSQDRRCNTAQDTSGNVWLTWPSDLRTSKRALSSGVYLAKLNAKTSIPTYEKEVPVRPEVPTNLPPRWGDDSLVRTRADRHAWTPNEKKYTLYWGDFHRHTDISNCRTAHDGCIVEQFRYAYDVGELDLLGTSDHTDIGKPYDPYEWWCNQKLADVFYVPDFFNSFYVYEREQRWPWGHRNVIFADRGGPIIYIKRELYKSMPWQSVLPIGDGAAEIHPEELWKLLRKNGQDVTIISHTGATGMGTDWDGYKQIDNAVENLVEIYQGARVSYEGLDTPQPTVGFLRNKVQKPDAHGSVKVGRDFGPHNKGVYQNALKNGYKLGVFANSDHISTNTSFGGVYTESFTREDLIKAFNARRTIAATDKIFMEFSCNGHLMGEIFETTEKPTMTVSVRGTAPLRAVTIVRNEMNIQRFEPGDSPNLDETFTDPAPLTGEYRYYVRVEQVDGNMGWTSPIWVTYKK